MSGVCGVNGTPASVDGKPPVKFLTSWFCPYAQRAWIALEEKGLKKGVDYEGIEALKMDDAGNYTKDPLLLKVNPKAVVPVILDQREGRDAKGFVNSTEYGIIVTESLVCVQYIDANFESDVKLMPSSPDQRAKCQEWIDFIDANVCSAFFRLMMTKDSTSLQALRDSMTAALQKFSSNIKGPYFMGEQFTAVDIAILPWIHRLFLLEHYKDYSVPTGAEFDNLRSWKEKVMSRPAVAATLADKDTLIDQMDRFMDIRK